MTPLIPVICALTVFFGASSVAAAATRPSANVFDWDKIRYMYAFGDSYTFVQGTAGHANFSFIGDALDFSFAPNELLSNEIIPRNTSSEGSNWIEFLTGCLGGSPLRCKKQLWNFAFAGSDIDSALLPLHHNFTIPLVDQVNQWVTYASKVIPHPVAETLTAWWIGINDTGDTLTNASARITDFPAFWETEMTSYFKAVQKAHDNGLKTHLFINVPAEDHATVMSFDSNTWWNTVLDSPAEYGFTNTTGCFFWFNTGHPTEKVHRLLANAIEAELRNPTFCE
ncbi:hypothetical protein B0H13DRAFT_2227081 [Mycena leptocephala]|nr:hypothetical protein B0H13DRAFT_2227081 [Mycena leptocephala]